MPDLNGQIKNLLKGGNLSEIDSICKPIASKLSISDANIWVRSRYLSGNYEGCIEICIFFQELFKNKNYIYLYLFHLRSLKKLNKINDEIYLASELLENKIYHDEIFSILIRYYYESRDYSKSLNICEKLILFNPINLVSLKFSARISNKLNHSSDIRLEKWKLVLNHNPNDLESKVAISRILFDNGEQAESFEILKEVIASNDNYAPGAATYERLFKNKKSLKLLKNNQNDTFKNLYKKKSFSEILSRCRKLSDIKNLSNIDLLYYFRSLNSTKQYSLLKKNYILIKIDRQIHINILKCIISSSFDHKDFDYHASLIEEYFDKHHLKDLNFGINELIKSNISFEYMFPWINYFLDHLEQGANLDDLFSQLSKYSHNKIILKINEVYEINKTSYLQYVALSQYDKYEKSDDLIELIQKPENYQVTNTTFSKLINACQRYSNISLSIRILDCHSTWKISANILNSNLDKILINISKSGNLNSFHDIILKYHILNCKIQKKYFERAVIIFINNGGIVSDLYSQIKNDIKNIPGGGSNLMSICYKCGLIEEGKKLWIFSLLRFLTSPNDESEFPSIVLSIGRVELIYELHHNILLHSDIISNNNEFIMECERIYSSVPKIFDKINNDDDKDSNLLEVSILTYLINNFSQKAYSPNQNKVMHVSNSVKKGGAERQVVNSLKNSTFKNCLALYNIDRNDSYNSFIDDIKNSNVELFDYSEIIDFVPVSPDIIKILECLPHSISLNPHMMNKIISLYKLFIKEKPQIVHLWQDSTNIIGGVAAKLAGVPKVIMSARSTPPFKNNDSIIPYKGEIYYLHQRFTRLLYKLLLQDSRFILCHNSNIGSFYYREWFGKNFPIETKMPILYNGFDLSIPKHAPEKEINSYTVGGIFRFKDVKRPFLWIDSALKLIKKLDNVNFIILGDGPLLNSCKNYIKKTGHGDKFQLIGFTDDVHIWLQNFDLLLLTSSVEGLPNVLIEAQAMGIPVVSTNAGGAKETFINDVSGILLTEDNPTFIASTLHKILINPEWRLEAGSAAIKWSQDNFHIDVMHKKLEELYGV